MDLPGSMEQNKKYPSENNNFQTDDGGAYQIRTGDLNDGCVIIALCSLRASARGHSDSQALGSNKQRYRSTCEQDKLGDDG